MVLFSVFSLFCIFLDTFLARVAAVPPHHSVFKPFFCIVIYSPPSQELPVFTSKYYTLESQRLAVL